MKIINENQVYEEIINKSRFIVILYYVTSTFEINEYLDNIRKIYKAATHYCYGYIINNIKKCCDDMEPNGTAGLPILSVLEKNDLNHILCIVVRYFGGIKLGSGGLIRAYGNVVSKALNLCDFAILIKGYRVLVSTTYDKTVFLDSFHVVSKKFDEQAHYIIELSDLSDISGFEYTIIDDIYIKEKMD